MIDVNEVVHWVIITCHTKRGNGNLVEYCKWAGMRFDQRCKWQWYFNYRSALLQVKYPKYHVEMRWGHESAVGKSKEQLLKNKKIAKKRKITEYQNKLDNYVKKYTSLFPIEKDEAYQLAVAKIEKYKTELKNIPNE